MRKCNDYSGSDYDGIEYRTFPEKGVVVCKIWGCADIAVERILKYTGNGQACFEDYWISPVFVGVARCAPEDTFDEEYGKQLALIKAKAKRGKAINNAIQLFINRQNRALETLRQYGLHEIPDPKKKKD